MNDLSNTKNYHLYSFMYLFIIFGQIHLSFSQLLNNIIRLGENNLRYNHINFNEKGDMIIDVSAFPVTQERKFFGLKKMEDFILMILITKKLHFIQSLLIILKVDLKGNHFLLN